MDKQQNFITKATSMFSDAFNPKKKLTPQEVREEVFKGLYGYNYLSNFGVNGTVSETQAKQVTPFYRGVTIISDALSELPFRIIRTDRDTGDITEVTDHDLVERLRKPIITRPGYTLPDLLQTVVTNLLIHGNAYLEVLRIGSGEVTSITPIDPTRVEVEVLDNGAPQYVIRPQRHTRIRRVNPTSSAERRLRYPDIIHVVSKTTVDNEGYKGESALNLLRKPLLIALEHDRHSITSLDGGSAKAWLKTDNKIPDDQRDFVRETLNDARQDQKISLLPLPGMSIDYAKNTNQESQFTQARRFTVLEFSRFFGIPPFMLSDSAPNSAFGTGLAALNQGFLQYVLLPHAANIEKAFTSILLNDRELDEGYDIRFNFNEFLRGSATERAAYYTSLVNIGVLKRSEVRRMESLPAQEGIDDEPMPAVSNPLPTPEPTPTGTPPPLN